MTSAEYASYDAIGLAKLVRSGTVSAEELVEIAYSQIERVNPTINAVVRLLSERVAARLRAGLPDGRFTGVPMLIKDEFDIAGTRSTRGSVLLRDHIAGDTPEVIRRVEASGTVFVGRTNMPEFGLLPFTEPTLNGPTANPWNTAFSPGGSSGGSAAAVAAGIVPIANGGDGGGSIRIPASCCGVFGLKPSRGRNPARFRGYDSGLTVHHVLTRTVRDSAAMLDVTRGPRPGEHYMLPDPEVGYATAIERPPSRLRIGFAVEDFRGNPAHSECARAVSAMAHRLESLGHHVEEAAPTIPGDEFYQAFKLKWCQGAGSVVQSTQRALARNPQVPMVVRRLLDRYPLLQLFLKAYRTDGMPLLETFTRALADLDRHASPSDLLLAERVLKRAERSMGSFFRTYDLFLTPTVAHPPYETGTFDAKWKVAVAEQFLLRYVAYTQIANTGGFPAMSVPTTQTDAGVPVGTQFTAPLAREDLLLRLAAQLESAFPWSNSRPPVWPS